MPIVFTSLSIRPGQTRTVTQAVSTSLAQAPAASGFLSIWATEIGEVNTLSCLHVDNELETLLNRLNTWLEALANGETGACLRHVQIEAFRPDTASLPVEALRQPCVGLLLEDHQGPVAVDPAQQLLLHGLHGRHGRRRVLTPVLSWDDAVNRARHASEIDSVSLRGSALLIPVV